MARRDDDDDDDFDDDYDDEDEEEDRPRRKKPPAKKKKKGGGSFMDLLLFKRSFGVPLVAAVFWLGVAWSLYEGGMSVYNGIRMGGGPVVIDFGKGADMRNFGLSRTSLFLSGAYYILVQPLVLRVLCEGFAEMLRVNENLSDVKRAIEDSYD